MSALLNSYAQIKFSGVGIEHNPTTTAVKITGFDSGDSSQMIIADYSESKIKFSDNGAFRLHIVVDATVDDLKTYTFYLKLNGVVIGDLDIDLERKENSIEFVSIGYLPTIVYGDEIEMWVSSNDVSSATFIPTHLMIDVFKVGT